MSKSGDSGGTPRAIVHKRILDVAASNPDATLDDIAGEISAATPDLVERVLAEYGDPADQEGSDPMTGNEQPPAERDEQSASDPQPPSESESERDSEPEPEPESAEPAASDLTVKQRETARVVHEHPEASQAKIADELGVTRATVSRRLNEIPGFGWAERAAFTEALFGERPEDGDDDSETQAEAEPEPELERAPADALSEFEERLSAVEAAVADVAAEQETEPDAGAVMLPPELAHKVIHAAIESDRISEEEELQLLEALLR